MDKPGGEPTDAMRSGQETSEEREMRAAGELPPGWMAYPAAVVVGVVYGLGFRAMTSATPHAHDHTGVMTLSFLALGSFVTGMLAVYPAERTRRRNALLWLGMPTGAVVLECVLSVCFKMEGWICVLFALPGALVCAAVGGVVGGLLARFGKRKNGTVLGCALLPLLLAPLETFVGAPVQVHTVENDVRIHASAAVVWDNIKTVRAIAPEEIRTTWAQRIGFPRPVAATLSCEGLGGVRDATFERGVRFIETVNVWQPEQRLAFAIRADTEGIPPTTLDEHVTVGGPYFDVLDGEYRLEPLPGGDTLLHLTSHQRLSTHFNEYAGWWTGAVMSSLQSSILDVVRKRAEGISAAGMSPPACAEAAVAAVRLKQ